MYQFMYGKDFIEWETLLIRSGEITKYTTTPDNIDELENHEVFVFGSNKNWNHAGGAAKLAQDKFGAVEGEWEGLFGKSYAFPTLGSDMKQLSKEELEQARDNLYKSCAEETKKIFFLTKVWCGIAGYDEEYMKNLFVDSPANLVKPEWR